MKKITTLFLFSFILLASCSKNDGNKSCGFTESKVVAPQSEINNVQAYLAIKGISATQHPSGLFYTIEAAGTGATAGLCNVVSVKYVGTLSNGTVFDQTTGSPVAFTLGQLILGWQHGLPLIKPGGKMHLYVPPTLGYGSSANGSIPANSMLIFDMELVAVQ